MNKIVCGVDEAGRGPLAGPVYAAAVVLPEGLVIEGLDDSKKLSEKKRNYLYDIICEKAVCYGISFSTVDEIEELNILQATFLAMNRAIQLLNPSAQYALIDGNNNSGIAVPSEPIIHGDSLIASISAASVLAKVSRDRFMYDMAEKYPEYGFEKHKGYGTKDHYAAIRQYGITDIHRKSFLKNLH